MQISIVVSFFILLAVTKEFSAERTRRSGGYEDQKLGTGSGVRVAEDGTGNKRQGRMVSFQDEDGEPMSEEQKNRKTKDKTRGRMVSFQDEDGEPSDEKQEKKVKSKSKKGGRMVSFQDEDNEPRNEEEENDRKTKRKNHGRMVSFQDEENENSA